MNLSSEMENAITCKICYEKFTLTDRRPRTLVCGHSFCTNCCGELVRRPQVECPICMKKSGKKVNNVNDIKIAFQTEEILQALNADEQSKYKQSGTELCLNHGLENMFFCQSHSKFICYSCCNVEYSKDKSKIIIKHSENKCKIMNKNEALKISVDKCHTEIEAENKEFKELKCKLLNYITILKKEMQAHSDLQRKLSELASKHEQQKNNLCSERIIVENFLVEQETNLNRMYSLKQTEATASIQDAKNLTDATANIIEITRNNKLTEEKRCCDFKQLDSSFEARQSTELAITQMKTITNTQEAKKFTCKLKGSGFLKDLAKKLKLLKDVVPNWPEMVNIGHWLVCVTASWWKHGPGGLAGAIILLLVIMGVHRQTKLMITNVSELLLLGQGAGFYLRVFIQIVFERFCALLPILVISIVLRGGNDMVVLLWHISLVATARWPWREELSRHGLMDAAACALSLLPIIASYRFHY